MNITVNGKNFFFAHTYTPHAGEESFFRHCHAEYELLFFQKGRAHYVVEDRRYALSPRTVLFIRPKEYHYLDLDAPCEYERCIFNFSEDFVPESVRGALNGRARFFLPDRASPLAERFLSLSRACDLFPADVLPGMLSAALLETVYLYALTAPDTEPAETDEKLMEVLGYIADNLSGELSVASVARAVYLSPSRLSHLFSERMKVGLMQYVAMKRVALAGDLLAKNVRPTEVAERTGFRDYSTFYRVYRKMTGKSPSGRTAEETAL